MFKVQRLKLNNKTVQSQTAFFLYTISLPDSLYSKASAIGSTPGEIRTLDTALRRRVLYPAELQEYTRS